MKHADIPNLKISQGSDEVITRPGAPLPLKTSVQQDAAQTLKKPTRKSAKKSTPKEAEPLKKAEKPQRKMRKRGSAARAKITMSAAVLSFLWIGGLSAFSYGFYTAEGVHIGNLAPGIWAGLITALLVPIGLIWLGATVLARLLDLNETSLRLAAVSRELTDPGATAANDVAKLGATIRKELNGLNREIETAVSRVSELEARLKQHTNMIDETGKRVEKRTIDIASRLSEEREKVDAATRTLSNEARMINETLDMQSHAINKAASEATDALKEANESLSLRTTGLDRAASDAAETTKTIAEDIERETGRLETISASARSRAEAISTRYSAQQKAMSGILAQQGEQQSKLEAAMDQQQRLVGNMAETVARQVQRIETTVSDAAEGFKDAIEEARVKADEAGMGFEGQIRAMSEATNKTADRLAEAAGAVAELSQEAQADLEAQMQGAEALITRQSIDARALLDEQVGKAKTLLSDQSETSRTQLAEQAVDARAELNETSDLAAARLTKQTDAAQSHLNAQSETAQSRLSEQSQTALEGLSQQSTTAQSRLEQQADKAQVKLVEQDATARALLEGQSKTASELLSGQADDLATALESSLENLRGRLSELTEKGSAAMIGRADDLDEALRAGEDSMRALSIRLDASIQGVQDGSADVSRLFSEAAEAFEARMAQFPAHADDAVGKVRSQISAQIEALAKLADAAAGKAHDLTQAIVHQNINPAPASDEDENQVELFDEPPVLPPVLSTEMPKAGFNLKPRDPAPKAQEPSTDTDANRRRRLGEGLASSLKGRLYSEPLRETEAPAGLRAAESTGALRVEELEDISSFTVKHPQDTKPASQERGERLNAIERPVPVSPEFEDRGWKQILATVDERETERANRGTGDDASFQRDALLIIEKLQALSIDLDRALEDAPSTELLDRYMSGERNVFARRLATFTGPDMLQRIARTHREDAEFRTVVNRYIESFEGLLRSARGRDRENILVETYLTSQTGKVYMILGTATGHLK